MKNRRAFTLAETLITIAIIGVVAAIVIPVTMQKVQDYVFGKSKENSLMKITEATKEMKSNDVLSGYNSNIAFANKFAEYMMVVKQCDATNLDDCFVDKFKTTDGDEVDTSTLTTGTKLSKKNIADGTIAMMLKNGTTMLFSLRDKTKLDATDPSCDRIDPFNNTSNTTGCMSFLYDINGRGGPNTLGRDIGYTNVTAFSCEGYKTADGTCFSGAFTPSPMSFADCNAAKGGPLGIQNCGYNGDVWAGAVAHCGGVSNMPNQDQLATLANELYGCTTASSSSPTGSTDCTGALDYTKAAKAGLPSSGSFYVWSSVESSSYGAYARYFTSTYSRRNGYDRRDSSTFRAVCLSP